MILIHNDNLIFKLYIMFERKKQTFKLIQNCIKMYVINSYMLHKE